MRAVDLAGRGLLFAAAVVLIAWLLRRGPLVAPLSLFSAVASTNGFFSASHIVAAMALLGSAAGLWHVFFRRAAAPGVGPALAVGLPLLALALATRHAVYPHDARYDLAVAAGMVLLFAALVAAVGRHGGFAAALAALAGLGVWLALAGLRQFAAGQPTPEAWTGPAFAAAIPVRITATLHNPNELAAALLLGIGGAAGLAVGARPLALRLLGWLGLLPLAAALPLTFSRGAYLGLTVAAALAAALLPPGRRLRGLAALAAVALAVGAVAYKVPGVLFRVHSISVQAGGDVRSRVFTWRDVLAVYDTRPLRGVGPGGLDALYGAHEPPGGTGTYVLIDVPGSADDDPLQWLAATGALGAGLLVLGIGAGLWAVGRSLRHQEPDRRAAAAALLGCLAGVGVQGLFEVTAYLLPVEGLGLLAMAALCGAAGGAGPVRWSGLRRLLGLGLAAGGLFAAAALWQAWAPEQAFAAGWSQVAAGRPAAGLPLLQEAAAADPSSERDLAALGDAQVQLAYSAAPDQAAAHVRAATGDLGSALRLDPMDGDAWAAVASLLRRDGTTPAAACAQQAALADFPGSPWDADLLAGALAALGYAAEARTDYGYAARLFPFQLDVYREYGDQAQAYFADAGADMSVALTQWGTAPLPSRAVLPVPAATCAEALAAAGLPPGAYAAAVTGMFAPRAAPPLPLVGRRLSVG